MRKSESEHTSVKSKGVFFNDGLSRSKTLEGVAAGTASNPPQVIPLSNLRSNQDILDAEESQSGGGVKSRKSGNKLAYVFKNVYHSMRNILSKSPSFSTKSQSSHVISDSNVCYDRLSTSEADDNHHQFRDGNGNCFYQDQTTTPQNGIDPPQPLSQMSNGVNQNQLVGCKRSSDFFECLSQGSWDDEDVTCNVCDRAFLTPWHLERHRRKKRHWGCDVCDSLFTSLWHLESHKAEFDHWSYDECDDCSDDSDGDDCSEDWTDFFDDPDDPIPVCTCNEICCVTPSEEEKIMLLP